MLLIIWNVIKIILLCLLVLLAVCLLVVLLLLTVPFCWQTAGSFDSDHMKAAELRFRVTWLWRFMVARGSLGQDGLSWDFLILGIPLRKAGAVVKNKNDRIKKRKKEAYDHESSDSDKAEAGDSRKSETTDSCAEADSDSLKVEVSDSCTSDSKGPQEAKRLDSADRTIRKKASSSDPQNKRRKSTGQSVSGRKKKSQAASILSFMTDEQNKAVIREIIRRVLAVLKHIRPRRLRGKAAFGFEDPSLTGRTLGGAAMLMGLYKDNLKLFPCFDTEKNFVRGEGEMRGHMILAVPVFHLLPLFFNRRVRKLFRS